MRFYAVDPQMQTASPYLFCGNNPILYVDENGEWFLVDDAIIAAVGFIGGSCGYTTGNPYLAAVGGGGFSGALGSSIHGELPSSGFTNGAISSLANTYLTMQAYSSYGKYLTIKYYKDGEYGKSDNNVNCIDFAVEAANNMPGSQDAVIYDVTHIAIKIGRTKYGETIVIQKDGPSGPIKVQPARTLSLGKGAIKPFNTGNIKWNGYGKFEVFKNGKNWFE